ncbi:MAG: alanyl-tRNA editing protein [Proteobacteria bacterium]|nr:alanyl-tRNA editing protein [Pseudomonadota bacterium]
MERIFEDDAYARACDAVVISAGAEGIRLDRTVFYAMGGGQPGDTGVLRLEDGSEVAIVDARRGESPGDVVHVPAEGAALPAAGAKVTAEIDWQRRHRLMRIHTCLHLLCAVVDGPVTGGQISDGKGRLDFDIPELTLDKEAIRVALNRLIEENHAVRPRWITDDELAAEPELVKTMSVRPPMGQGRVRLLEIEGVDLQACGGTHVAATGEIGRVEVRKIENKGRHNRRVVIAFAGE